MCKTKRRQNDPLISHTGYSNIPYRVHVFTGKEYWIERMRQKDQDIVNIYLNHMDTQNSV